MDGLITLKEASARYGLPVSQLRLLWKRGWLRGEKVWVARDSSCVGKTLCILVSVSDLDGAREKGYLSKPTELRREVRMEVEE